MSAVVVVVVVAIVVAVMKCDEDSCRSSTSAPHFQRRDRDVESGHGKSIHMCKLKKNTKNKDQKFTPSKTRRKSYEKNLVLNKLVLNVLTMHYFNLDYNNTEVVRT